MTLLPLCCGVTSETAQFLLSISFIKMEIMGEILMRKRLTSSFILQSNI